MKRSRIGRMVAGTVLAVGVWTGLATAAPLTGNRLLQMSDSARDFYIFGVMDTEAVLGVMKCGVPIRKGAILEQSLGLVREHQDEAVVDMVIVALHQLGCRAPEPLPTKAPA
jgi:hypothetical protein